MRIALVKVVPVNLGTSQFYLPRITLLITLLQVMSVAPHSSDGRSYIAPPVYSPLLPNPPQPMYYPQPNYVPPPQYVFPQSAPPQYPYPQYPNNQNNMIGNVPPPQPMMNPTMPQFVPSPYPNQQVMYMPVQQMPQQIIQPVTIVQQRQGYPMVRLAEYPRDTKTKRVQDLDALTRACTHQYHLGHGI